MTIKTKEDAARALKSVEGDRRFYCTDGYIASNLEELADCLRRMSLEAFNHHVNIAKNDFSIWVRDVMGDKKLADDLQKTTDREQIVQILSRRMVWLKKKAQ
jgi:hypothetical protein